jgi:choline dehydrogenase-like flavoprotein
VQVQPPTDVTIVETTRATTANGYHFVAGCAVGSVLGADLKVKGFTNLRVVDKSSIPEMPRIAGPASSVYILAEYAAERIIAGK